MVQVRVQVVHADSVDAHDLQEGSVTHAGVGVAERILALLRVVSCTAAGLVGNADELELVAVGVDKVGSLDGEGLDGTHGGGGQGHESSLHLHGVKSVSKRLE